MLLWSVFCPFVSIGQKFLKNGILILFGGGEFDYLCVGAIPV